MGTIALASATEATTASGWPGWSVTMEHDACGNRWVPSASNLAPHLATPTAPRQYNAATNRIACLSTGAAMPTGAYDNAGRLLTHPYVGTFTHDVEGRMKTATYRHSLFRHDSSVRYGPR